MQAHRSLAGEASTASLLLVAATQRDLTRTAAIVGGAQQTQTGRQLTLDQARVAAALTDLDESWGQVREDLTRLRPMHVRPGGGLLLAGNELRAAMREITHDATGLDAPAAMAARVDLEATVRVTSVGRGLPRPGPGGERSPTGPPAHGLSPRRTRRGRRTPGGAQGRALGRPHGCRDAA